jgi:hypothetical protein
MPARVEGAPRSRSQEYKHAWYLANRERTLAKQRAATAARRAAAPPRKPKPARVLARRPKPAPIPKPKPEPVSFPLPVGPALDALRELARRARGALTFHRNGAVSLLSLSGAQRWQVTFASPEKALEAFERGNVTWVKLALPEYVQGLAGSVRRDFASMRNS